jgi:hypothetical protein
VGTIATNLQTRQKDCYQTSERVRLTLRTNGEERTSVITPQQTIVLAGFDAPETQPTGSVGGGGSLSGYYVYAYVYASTKYPYVQNAVTVADGELWPRSNPSPMSAVQNASAGSRKVTLTIATTSRTDVDKILIYRTQAQTASAAAQALADAGTLYYIGQASNPGVDGTTTFEDAGLTDTGEALELDNYVADTAEYCVFDGTYWWTGGSPLFTASVTLDGTSDVTISGEKWFSGRDGQIATFDGIASGGFDSAGSWYLKVTGETTGTLYADPDLTVPLVVPYTGTTTINVRGLTNILYRSKPFNPFSWGLTETQVDSDGAATTNVPQSFALNLGGGAITAMGLSPNGKRLVIHFENPQRSISLDLEQADSEDFGKTAQVLDNSGSVTCHFTLFNGYIGDKPMLLGFDHYNGNIVASDGYSQQVISEVMGDFLYSISKADRAPKFFHGSYDAGTELNCFWLRMYDTDEHCNIMVWNHAPTGAWGWMPDFDVVCSAPLLDSETGERMVIGGTEGGFMGQLLAPPYEHASLYYEGVASFVTNWTFNAAFYPILTTNALTSEMQFFCDAGQFCVEIVQTDPANGVLRTAFVPWVVGQEIMIGDPNGTGPTIVVGRVVSITQISDTEYETTLDTAYTSQVGSLKAGPHVRYIQNAWFLVNNFDENTATLATNAWFVKLAYTSLNLNNALATFGISYYNEVGSTELIAGGEGAPPWPYDPTFPFGVAVIGAAGGIPCAFRSYFDLNSPTIDKRSFEFWATIDPSAGFLWNPFVRHYQQFDSNSAQGFWLNRDALTVGENPPSGLAWFNKTQVPSLLLKEMGWELMDINLGPTVFYNFTVKVQEA